MEELCLKNAEKISRLEADVENVQDANRIFRNEIHDEIKEIRQQNEAIHKIATSVELVAQEMRGVKASVEDVRVGQQELSKKMDGEIEKVRDEQSELRDAVRSADQKEAGKLLSFWDDIKGKVAVTAATAIAMYLLYQFMPFLVK